MLAKRAYQHHEEEKFISPRVLGKLGRTRIVGTRASHPLDVQWYEGYIAQASKFCKSTYLQQEGDGQYFSL